MGDLKDWAGKGLTSTVVSHVSISERGLEAKGYMPLSLSPFLPRDSIPDDHPSF